MGIKQEIKQFEQQNGSLVNYTIKELIGRLDTKLDKINQRLIQGEKSFERIDTNLKWHKRLILGLYSIFGAILIGVLSSINYFKRLFGG